MARGSSFTYSTSHGRNKITTWEEELSRFITGNQEISIGSAAQCMLGWPTCTCTDTVMSSRTAQRFIWFCSNLQWTYDVILWTQGTSQEHGATAFLNKQACTVWLLSFQHHRFYKYSASDLNMYQSTTQREMLIFVINTLIFIYHIFIYHTPENKNSNSNILCDASCASFKRMCVHVHPQTHFVLIYT